MEPQPTVVFFRTGKTYTAGLQCQTVISADGQFDRRTVTTTENKKSGQWGVGRKKGNKYCRARKISLRASDTNVQAVELEADDGREY